MVAAAGREGHEDAEHLGPGRLPFLFSERAGQRQQSLAVARRGDGGGPSDLGGADLSRQSTRSSALAWSSAESGSFSNQCKNFKKLS